MAASRIGAAVAPFGEPGWRAGDDVAASPDDERRAGVSHYRRGPRQLAPALDHLADALAPETLLADIQRTWPVAVGAMIAAQAQPTAARAGVVTISCSASVWAQELDLMAPELIRQLNGLLARGSVQRLRCVATGHAR